MSGHNWKPGDVARWAECLGSGGLLFRTEDGWFDAEGDKRPVLTDAAVSRAARPLVVIDPESSADIDRLYQLLLAQCDTYDEDTPDELRAALREFATPTPPKPDEPQGLGAVVEDANGAKWVRAGHSYTDPNWRRAGGDDWTPFDQISAVRVLSEGVVL